MKILIIFFTLLIILLIIIVGLAAFTLNWLEKRSRAYFGANRKSELELQRQRHSGWETNQWRNRL